jgi:hypothetical protein
MRKSIFVILAILIQGAMVLADEAGPVVTRDCTDTQREILQSYIKRAPEYIDAAITELKRRHTDRNSSIASVIRDGVLSRPLRIQRSINTLICAKFRFQQLHYRCVPVGSYNARTWPIVGNEVLLSDSNFFIQSSEIYAIGTLVHEATHKCGTTDSDYFTDDYPPRDIGFIPWEAIASTYSYWIRYGVCIPGEDCPI